MTPTWARFAISEPVDRVLGGPIKNVRGQHIPPPAQDLTAWSPELVGAVRRFLTAAEDVRLNERPCCEGCVSDAWEEFARLEALVRDARRALPTSDGPRTAELLFRSMADALRDYTRFLRQSPTRLMPRRYQPWDRADRQVALDAVTVLTGHLAAVLAQLRLLLTLADGTE